MHRGCDAESERQHAQAGLPHAVCCVHGKVRTERSAIFVPLEAEALLAEWRASGLVVRLVERGVPATFWTRDGILGLVCMAVWVHDYCPYLRISPNARQAASRETHHQPHNSADV